MGLFLPGSGCDWRWKKKLPAPMEKTTVPVRGHVNAEWIDRCSRWTADEASSAFPGATHCLASVLPGHCGQGPGRSRACVDIHQTLQSLILLFLVFLLREGRKGMLVFIENWSRGHAISVTRQRKCVLADRLSHQFIHSFPHVFLCS